MSELGQDETQRPMGPLRRAPQRRQTLKGLRVLLAEDEFLIAQMLEDCLADEGMDVTVTQDGMEALDAAKADEFDLLVTDMRMPRLDGAGLIRQLQACRPTMPVLILTSHAPRDWQALRDNRAAPLDLMEKPVDLPQLVAHIATMLQPARPEGQAVVKR